MLESVFKVTFRKTLIISNQRNRIEQPQKTWHFPIIKLKCKESKFWNQIWIFFQKGINKSKNKNSAVSPTLHFRQFIPCSTVRVVKLRPSSKRLRPTHYNNKNVHCVVVVVAKMQ